MRPPDGWKIAGGMLQRTFTFKTFLAAMRFVQRLAKLAHQANHHPEIDIRYDKVTLRLFTHDAKAITHKDYALAAQLNLTASNQAARDIGV